MSKLLRSRPPAYRDLAKKDSQHCHVCQTYQDRKPRTVFPRWTFPALTEALPAFDDEFAGSVCPGPAGNFCLLALKALVDGKEVLDLAQQMREDLIAFTNPAIDRIVFDYS